MPKRFLDQRLVAILAADVAGYSRLMEADEQRMHFRFGVNLGDVIEKDDGSVYAAQDLASWRASKAWPHRAGIMISEDIH